MQGNVALDEECLLLLLLYIVPIYEATASLIPTNHGGECIINWCSGTRKSIKSIDGLVSADTVCVRTSMF
jgi:hypothetical protein